MSKEFDKTEADFAYERYRKMGEVSPNRDIPKDDLEPVGTITAQSLSEGPEDADTIPVRSALDGHEPLSSASSGSGMGQYPDSGLGRRADRVPVQTAPPVAERDELLVSDALLAAEAAGLTAPGGTIDYAEEERGEVMGGETDIPLEDVPDADELQAGSPVDPVAPPVDAMPGTDLLNGSTGEED